MVSRLTSTSTCPVSSLAFTVSADRARTRPSTPTTNSDRSRFALPSSVSSSLSNTTCVTPARSRTSMKSTPPRSRTRWTQPSSTTPAPTSLWRRAPQVCVRVSSPSASATVRQYLTNRGARRGLGIGGLGLGRQVLDSHGAGRHFVAAQYRDKWDVERISVLDLLAELVRLGVDQHAQAVGAQPRRQRQDLWAVGGGKKGHHHVGWRLTHGSGKNLAICHHNEDSFETQREPAGWDRLT